MAPESFLCVAPSMLGVGEEFAVRVKVLGPVVEVPNANAWNTVKPRLRGPFNVSVQRGIKYLDNCLPEWTGTLEVDGGGALEGPARLEFDGADQGVFPGDARPIKTFGGFRWTRPGFHFLKFTDPASGIQAWANPVYVTEESPQRRLYWGDPHWQTFFSDGIRCPEELYAFARDEAFLDFGALSDHLEAVTDRQWDYMVAVTNDYNDPGRFAALVGLEWTNHNPAVGAPGHRNVYYRGADGPAIRSTDPRYDTLEKFWGALDGLEAIAIPHHSANKVMGVDWGLGWRPEREVAVEIHSIWGNSECHADDGNPMPIRTLGGEVRGRHVVDALRKGYRFGFVGGGDIHDGRPGDELAILQPTEGYGKLWPQGFTGAWAPALSRENVYDAVKRHATYATTKSRIYLDVSLAGTRLAVKAASEEGIGKAAVIRNGSQAAELRPDTDPRVIETVIEQEPLGPEEFLYVRLTTGRGNMAWSSPFFGTAPDGDGPQAVS